MSRPISETVQHRAYDGSQRDSHGNVTDSWSDPDPVGIYAFSPGSTDETFADGHVSRVITTPTLYVPTAVRWADRDRVTVRGLDYEVDGDTLEYRNPTDPVADGNTVKLKRVAS